MPRGARMSTFGRDEEEKWRKQQHLKVVSSQEDVGWRAHVKHASKVLDMRFPEPAYVVPGFIPEGLTILGGRPKVGKRWLALELGLGVSLVEKVLGNIMPEAGDVLYAALEDTFPRLQRRMKKILWPAERNRPERLMLATQWKRLDEGGVADIEDWAQSVDAPKLVILDTLAQFRPKRDPRDTTYDGDYKALVELQRLANEKHFAVVVLHHTRKAEAEDPIDTISGTLGIAGCADTILVLSQSSIYVRGRDVEEAEKAVVFDKAHCRWKVLGDAAEVKRTEATKAILAAMSDTEARTPKEIAEELDPPMSQQTVSTYLRRLAKKGDVAQEGRGKFRRNTMRGATRDD
jgi:AAA domain/Penicillinase repressor